MYFMNTEYKLKHVDLNFMKYITKQMFEIIGS